MADNNQFRCGYVTLIGRPNVGKSTLMNHLLGQKLSIVSRKAQTTRWKLIGIKTTSNYQAIFIDTPGFQQSPKLALNRYMNKEVSSAIQHVDLVLFVIEALNWNALDETVLQFIQKQNIMPILVINKIDKLDNKKELLPFIEQLSGQARFSDIVSISAMKGEALNRLENCIATSLPISDKIYPDDQITDRSERFFAAEFIREKLTRRLGNELPYRLSVTIEEFRHIGNIIHIGAVIWVEKPGQKAIVIGNGGKLLKDTGKEARLEMQNMFNSKVNLRTWVKVRKKWMDSEFALKEFGYMN